MYADIKNYGVKLAIIRAYRNLIIRENAGFILFIYLFTQYFKRVTHLAKSSHSTKWPSTNIINSLKTHIT